MKEKQRIVLDFDSTLVNSVKAFIDVYNTLYEDNADWRNVRNWDFSCVCKKLPKGKVMELFEHPLFFEKLDFYPGALAVLSTLYMHGEFIFEVYSAGTPKNKEQKIELLKGVNNAFTKRDGYNFLNWLPCDSVMHGKSCQDLSDAIFVDDRVDNLQSSNAAKKILFKYDNIDYTWNAGWDGLVATQWDEKLKNMLIQGI